MTDLPALPAASTPFTPDEVPALRRLASAFGDSNPSDLRKLAKIAERPDEDIEILLEVVDDRKNASWAYKHLKSIALLAGTILAAMAAWKQFFVEK